MQPERVDVVVIGAGGGGAALTWRLASRGVGWCASSRATGTALRVRVGADHFEVQLRRGTTASSRRRGIGRGLPDRTAGDGPPTWSCGTAWAAARCTGRVTFRASIHPTSAFTASMGSPMTGRSPTDLEPFYDLNDRNVGVSGSPGIRRTREPLARRRRCRSAPARRWSEASRTGLALVALRQRDPLARLRRPQRLRQPRPLQLRLRAESARRPPTYLLAESASRRRAHLGAGQGNHGGRRWPRQGRD